MLHWCLQMHPVKNTFSGECAIHSNTLPRQTPIASAILQQCSAASKTRHPFQAVCSSVCHISVPDQQDHVLQAGCGTAAGQAPTDHGEGNTLLQGALAALFCRAVERL